MTHAFASLILLAAAPFGATRSLTPAAPGPARADVDVPLLIHAAPGGRLDDLRVFDAEGAEVPYLRVAPESAAPTWRAGRLLPTPATREQSGVEADLGSPVVIDRLRIEAAGAPFLKRVKLEGSADRQHWVTLIAETTLFDLPQDGLRRLELEVPPGSYRYLRLGLDDHASARLTIRGISARVVGIKSNAEPLIADLRFERRPSEPKVSRFHLHLPARRLPIVALRLSCGGGHLLRHAEVTEPALHETQVAPTKLGEATLRRTQQADLVAADLRIPIGASQGSDLDLVIDDGDNPPLDLTGVQAELAPQPWIYLEPKDARPLTAKLGAEGLAAPRYDLEAMRGTLSHVQPKRASWGEVSAANGTEEAATSSAPEAAVLAGAALDRASFPIERPILPGPTGLNAIALDAAVLATTHGNLEGLRIVDTEGRQVPYLIERRDEPLALPLALPAATTNPTGAGGSVRESAYPFTLPQANLPAGRLVLQTPQRVFDRNLRLGVETPPDERHREARFDTRDEARWSHADPDNPSPSLALPLESVPGTRAWVLIGDGDNQPLPLTRADLLLPAFRLRFFRTAAGSALTLLYGRSDLAAPQYDLALLAPRLVGASAAEVGLGDPQAVAAAQSSDTTPGHRLFWGALLLAVVVLLGLVARLLKPPAPPAPMS